MNILWTYVAIGVMTLAAAALVVGGETAMSELRFVRAAVEAMMPAQPAQAATPPEEVRVKNASEGCVRK